MKIKEFSKKYQEEKRLAATPQEEAMYEFCMSMKEMKKSLGIVIMKYEQGKMTVEDAHKLVGDTIYALLYANQLLGRMIKKQD